MAAPAAGTKERFRALAGGEVTMRAKAVATISFGLVDIPVRVYAAVESKSKIEFRLLHAKCNSRSSSSTRARRARSPSTATTR
jgi:hypothetical protein